MNGIDFYGIQRTGNVLSIIYSYYLSRSTIWNLMHCLYNYVNAS